MGQLEKQINTLKFIHITDTHLLDDESGIFHSINTKKSFETVLSESVTRYSHIDFVLITGDISQTGNLKSYLIFKSIIQDYTVPIYCVPGNHDTPKFLHNVLPSSPIDTVNVINYKKFSLLLLNSWVNNQHHGSVSKTNLLQLKEIINNNQDRIFIIAIHHSPIPVKSKWLDALYLQNQKEFLQLLQIDHRYKLVLFGHVHQKIDRRIANLRLISTPSTCHQFKPNSEIMDCILSPPPTYRYIELNDSFQVNTKIHHIK